MRSSRSVSQVKVGAIISYILIVANALYGLFVTPYILESLGNSSYGVYKSIASLSSAMMVLDLGLGGTVMRYIAKYEAEGENKKIQSFFSMILCEAGIIIAVVCLSASGVFFGIDNVYGKSFTENELLLAKNLFIVLSANMVLHIVENVVNGVITGKNNFLFGNGLKLVRFLIRLVFVCGLLHYIHSAMVLVWIDFGITLVSVVVESIYIRNAYGIKIRISLQSWDKRVFKESFVYTLLLFLTSIAAQINNNLDNVVIGAIKGSELVTIYSFGLVIFGMFEQLSTAVSGVMLPTVMNALKVDDGGKTLTDIIVKAGRVQFSLLGAAVVGFAVLGKQFIRLWLGNGFDDVYIIVMILMIPSTFELCVNVCLSVLRAKNKLGFRTAVLFASTVLNFIVTVIGIKYWDYKAAAVGTALSFIIGSLVVMNIYYSKILGFNMFKIYGGILKGILPSLLVGGLAIIVSLRFVHEGWGAFIIRVGIFCVIYALCLLTYGLNKEEKKHLPIYNRK